MNKTETNGCQYKPLEIITRDIKHTLDSKISEKLPQNVVYPYMSKVAELGKDGIYTFNSRKLNENPKELKDLTDKMYEKVNKSFHLDCLGISEEAYQRLSKLKTKSGKKAVDLLTEIYIGMGRDDLYLTLQTSIEKEAKKGKDLDEKEITDLIFEGINQYLNTSFRTKITEVSRQEYVGEMRDYINKTLEEDKGKISKEEKEKIQITDEDKYWFQVAPKYAQLVKTLFSKRNAKKVLNGKKKKPVKKQSTPIEQAEPIKQAPTMDATPEPTPTMETMH